jgi:hypothetical protein
VGKARDITVNCSTENVVNFDFEKIVLEEQARQKSSTKMHWKKETVYKKFSLFRCLKLIRYLTQNDGKN